MATGCGGQGSGDEADKARVSNLVASEELILRLTPPLRELADALKESGALPDERLRAQFDDSVEVTDLGPQPSAGEAAPVVDGLAIHETDWGVEPVPREVDAAALSLWAPALGPLAAIDNAKFAIVRGGFTDESAQRFVADIYFAARAREAGGAVAALHGDVKVTWRRVRPRADGTPAHVFDAADWVIAGWETVHFDVRRAPGFLFEDVTGAAIASAADLELATRSRHEEILSEILATGEATLPGNFAPFFVADATGQHPGLSVVDIDADGWDDLYVTVRWGRNLLFRNRGDGTFEEAAGRFGLDLPGLSSAAIFADFDNDGDDDALVARTLARSVYLENRDGKFVDVTDEKVARPLPYLAASVSVADVNNDGLLDAYFSTYGFPSGRPAPADVARTFLFDRDPDEVREHYVESDASQRFVDLAGPPNTLLLNRGGGRFAPASGALEGDVAVWRHSLQATFSDIDDDGDADFYVTNDFAPDNFFRNESGLDGVLRFTDVTREMGGEHMMGFGMGASFGDYDNDLRPDLYVSNMFSKAGLRITDQVAGIDPRFRRAAEGNLLFRNNGQTFDLVSGLEPPKLTVAKAGWSWGGQLADFTNDGFLDIYVSAGYFTAPEEAALEDDL